MKLSVVMPVYNNERDLAAAVESVLQQTMGDFELILVDDGATDGSGALCDGYARQDMRVRVLHQTNQGVSSARNAGMDAARGEALLFMDADDTVEPEMYEALLAAMEESGADLVVCGVQETTLSGDTVIRTAQVTHERGLYQGREAVVPEAVALLQRFLINSLFNKVYRLPVIRAHGLRFETDLDLGEDLLFNLAYLDAAPSVQFLPACYYHYMYRDNGTLVSRYRPDKFETMTRLYQGVCAFARPEAGTPLRRAVDFLYVKWAYSCYMDLFHPDCPLTRAQKREQIALTLANGELVRCARESDAPGLLNGLMCRAVASGKPGRVYFVSFMADTAKRRLGALYDRLRGSRLP